MGFAALPFVKEWSLSWAALARNRGYVAASAVMDVLFFLSFGFLTGPVRDKLIEHVIIIGTLLSQMMRAPEGRARPAVIDALFQPPVSHYTMQFIGLLFLLGAVMFVLYCIFHGVNWWLAATVAGKKKHWRDYLVQFARVNALWFVLYVAWYCIKTVFDLRRLAVEKLGAQYSAGPEITLTIAMIVLAYFAVVSYPLLSIRKAFSQGARGIPAIVPALVLIAVIGLVGNLVAGWLATVNMTVYFIAGTMLLLVLLAWARLYIARVVLGVRHGV